MINCKFAIIFIHIICLFMRIEAHELNNLLKLDATESQSSCKGPVISLNIEGLQICDEQMSQVQTPYCKILIESHSLFVEVIRLASQRPKTYLPFRESSNIFYAEMNLQEEFLYLRVSIEVIIEETVGIKDQILQPILYPKIQIEFKKNLRINSYTTQTYSFTSINSLTNLNDRWKGFRFEGNLNLNIVKYESAESVQLSVMSESDIFLKSFRVTQTNKLNQQSRDCGTKEQFDCDPQFFQFEPQIQSCVFRFEFRCSLGQFENVSLHTCLDTCSEREHQFTLPDGYRLCMKTFQTCDQNGLIGCRSCDRFSNICFSCEDGFQMNEGSYSCRFISVNEVKIRNTSLTNRMLYSANCMRPICQECVGGNVCIKCQSPFVNVHGACVICGRGTILDTSTDDHYCRKTTDKMGCSNNDSNSSTCNGCFFGISDSNCNQNTFPCTNTMKFSASAVSCLFCNVSVPFCQSCATANQCHTCQSGYKLAIQNYSVLNPDVICVLNCSLGFFEDQFGFCAPCGSNCDVCTQSSLTCSNCKSGFEVDKKYSREFPTRKERCIPVIRCPANCLNCSDPNICNSCPLGFALVNGYCEKCGIGCKTCVDGITCIECIDGIMSSTCLPINCFQNHYLSENLTCQPCIANCLSCWNPDSCDICSPGFVMEKYSCVPCPPNCAMCSDQNSCQMCDAGYKVVLDACVILPIPCPNPLDYYDTGYLSCQPCDSNCSNCSNGTLCTDCQNGLTPQLGTCSSCSVNQFMKIDLSCESCPLNCELCLIFIGCVRCKKGYLYDVALTQCIAISECGDGNMTGNFNFNGSAGIKTCDDKNKLDGDGCDSNCQTESGYICILNIVTQKSDCKQIPSPPTLFNRFWLEGKINSDTLNPIVVVRSDSTILGTDGALKSSDDLNKDIMASIIVDIDDIPSDQYSYTVQVVDGNSQKSCNLEFQVQRNILNKHITISFTASFVTSNNLINNSFKIIFPDFRPINEVEKKAAIAIATVGSVAGTSFLITVIPVILLSKFSFLFNALDLFQMIYYLQFLNIRFPYNIQEFLRIMSNFKVSFAQNFIGWYLEANPVESAVVPAKFMDKSIDGVFLKNTGDHYSQVIIILFLHLFLHAIVWLTYKSKVGFLVKAGGFLDGKLTSSWQWGWYLDKFWEMFLSVVVGCTLQFYGLNLDNFSAVLNAIMFIISVATILLSPIIFWKLIQKNDLSAKETKQKWGMLYEGLKIRSVKNNQIVPISESRSYLKESNSESKILTFNQSQSDQEINQNTHLAINKSNAEKSNQNNTKDDVAEKLNLDNHGISFKYARFFYIILYIRKICFGVIIGTLYNNPLQQLILIDTLNVCIAIILIAFNPFESCLHSLKGLICELLMIVAQISLKQLIEDPLESNESDRMKIGWVFIASCVVILFIQIVFVIVSLIIDLYKQAIEWWKKRKQNKVTQSTEIEQQKTKNVVECSVIDLNETRKVVDLDQSNQSTNRDLKTMDDLSQAKRLKGLNQVGQNREQRDIELGKIDEESLSAISAQQINSKKKGKKVINLHRN